MIYNFHRQAGQIYASHVFSSGAYPNERRATIRHVSLYPGSCNNRRFHILGRFPSKSLLQRDLRHIRQKCGISNISRPRTPTRKHHHEIARPEFYKSPALTLHSPYSFHLSPALEVRTIRDILHDFPHSAYLPTLRTHHYATQRRTGSSLTPTHRPDQPEPSLTSDPTHTH